MEKKFFVIIAGLCISFAACSQKGNNQRTTVSHPQDSVVIRDSTYSVREVENTLDSMQNRLDSVVSIKQDLINEVSGYIRSVAPRSKMSAINIVEICIEHDYDITLLLSQGHIETHFGTSGRNVFGIYGQRHSHPDDYVKGYVKLMKSKYIINRTTDQLLAANVNMENNRTVRYAGNPNYGKEVGNVRREILKNTNILPLFNQLRLIRKETLEI